MRIISGRLKGRRLPLLKSHGTRPTTDFAREALFNVLEHKKELDQCNFLDLFSGTGAVSFDTVQSVRAGLVPNTVEEGVATQRDDDAECCKRGRIGNSE